MSLKAREISPFDGKSGSFARSSLDIPSIRSGDYWTELRYFLAVAKGNSIARASELLNVSPKTVSRSIKRLQDVLGVQLIVQTRQGIALTKPGLELAAGIADVDHKFDQLVENIRAQDNDIEAVVRVGVTDALGAFFVAPSLASFREVFPKIGVDIRSIIYANDLRANAVDLMIASVPMPGDDIVFEQCGYIHFVPMVSTQYVEKYGLPNVHNISEHTFIHSEFFDTIFWADWKKLVERGSIGFKTDSSYAYGTMIKTGLGIGLMASFMCVDPNLMPLQFDIHMRAPIFIVTSRDNLSQKPIRVTQKWLIELFSNRNPWFRPEMELDVEPNSYDAGLRRMLNVEGL